MKKFIKSSRNLSRRKIIAASANDYTGRFTYNRGGQKFIVYTKYENDPYSFQCQITEVHPYDDGEYFWVKKDAPASATVYTDAGKRYGYIEVDEYDEEFYESPEEYIDAIVDYMCSELRNYNRNVEPRIIHN